MAELRSNTLRDESNRPLMQNTICPDGWTYQHLNFEIQTGILNCLYAKDYAGDNVPGLTLKFFDGSGNELIAGTQAELDSSCVVTQLDYEPTVDFVLVGGGITHMTVPTNDLRLYVVGVPDLSAAYGGSKEFIVGLNLKFHEPKFVWDIDGRTGKKLTYDATYHTNKMRLICKHSLAENIRIKIHYETYKA